MFGEGFIVHDDTEGWTKVRCRPRRSNEACRTCLYTCLCTCLCSCLCTGLYTCLYTCLCLSLSAQKGGTCLQHRWDNGSEEAYRTGTDTDLVYVPDPATACVARTDGTVFEVMQRLPKASGSRVLLLDCLVTLAGDTDASATAIDDVPRPMELDDTLTSDFDVALRFAAAAPCL